jgi:hypothetical protein
VLNSTQHILLGLLVFATVSCNFFNKEEVDDTAIARVNDTYLLSSELAEIIPQGSSSEDSLLIANNYIQKWIKEQLVLDKAELNLKEEHRDFEKQLDEYRKTLTIYSYENQLINEILDSNVSIDEIAAFYQENNNIFILKNDIVKVRFLKVNKNAPNIKKITKYYRSNKPEELEKLKELAHQYAEKFHLDEEEWVLFDEIKKEIPNTTLTSDFLRNNKSTIQEDSTSMYFIHFLDYRLEKAVSPLSFEKENIKNMIINKRKIKLLTQLKNDLYEQASINKDFEIYGIQNKSN